MRPSGALFHSSTVSKMAALHEASAAAPTIEQSPWRSPVPYLFGGLAAMLGLIAFALLILACSYWKLSGQVDGGDDVSERDVEGGSGVEKGESSSDAKGLPALEEKFLVIMAGDMRPSFLATPAPSDMTSHGKDKENEKPKDWNQMEVVTIQENGESS